MEQQVPSQKSLGLRAIDNQYFHKHHDFFIYEAEVLVS